ncbi:hypothetical protein B0H13DRAFT_1916369 [Mycena leptocephala]|nr:hypothetical protein B0H13DRAFT_1916369 [Mycena leptocephala]
MESRKSIFLLHSVLYIWFPLTRVLTYTFIGVSARPTDNLRNYRGCRGYGDLSEQYPESQRRSSRKMVGDLPRHANHCTPSRDVREVFSEQKTNEISNPMKDSVSAVNRKAAMHYNRQGNGGCNPRVGRSCDTKHHHDITRSARDGEPVQNGLARGVYCYVANHQDLSGARPRGSAAPLPPVPSWSFRNPRKRMALRWPKAEGDAKWRFRARQRRTRRTGQTSGRTRRRLEEARSFDVAVGDVGRVANVVRNTGDRENRGGTQQKTGFRNEADPSEEPEMTDERERAFGSKGQGGVSSYGTSPLYELENVGSSELKRYNERATLRGDDDDSAGMEVQVG